MAVWSEIYCSKINQFGRSDAEYCHPDYQNLYYDLIKCNPEKLKKLAFITDGIHASPDVEKKNGIRYISAKCVKANSFVIDNCIFISSKQNDANPRTQLCLNDVIITTVGTIGNVAVVTEDIIPSNCDRHVGIIRTNWKSKIDPYYISIFLNSKYGKFQSLRESAGNVQLNLYISNIGKILIPRFGNDENQIADIVKKAYEKRNLSQLLYAKAKELLDHELGLNKLVFDKPLSYETRLSEVVGNNRADADYYQIPFRTLKEHLKTLNTEPLGKIASIVKGIEVGSHSYVENGIPFLRVSNLKEDGIILGNSDKHISPQLFSSLKKYQPQIGEILLTKDGTPGVCYSDTEEIEGIISGGIVRLKVQDYRIPKEYLSLVINSRICKMQIDQECSGALIMHWKPSSISKLRIPVLPENIMKEIGRLVSESKKVLTESKQLLEQAKRRVEELIEQTVQK
jgi:restriction endonuclease S subunit